MTRSLSPIVTVFVCLSLAGQQRLLPRPEDAPLLSATTAPVASPGMPVEDNLMANAPAKPNIIVVMADDLDVNSMNAAVAAGFMPNVKKFLIDTGTTFTNFFASDAYCCPSRATFFTGQYPHNHGVTDNIAPWNVVAFKETNTLPIWLERAGYQTALIGKYFNLYGLVDMNKDGVINGADAVYIPPGWNDWEAMVKGYAQYGYTLSVNGKLVTYGQTPADYQTDVIGKRAVAFIQKATTPFFLEVTPTAPHIEMIAPNWPPVTYPDMWKLTVRPAPRHMGTVNLTLPRGQAFNEMDVSDKTWINPVTIPLLTDVDLANLQSQYNDRIAATRAIDDLVGLLLQTVRAKGQWNNTVFLLTSDNGFLLGEHRLSEKSAVYEESIRIPLYVRRLWESTPRTSPALLLMNDMAPTIAQMAGAVPGLAMDGTSFGPLLQNPSAPWRLRMAVEHWDHTSPATTFYIPEYHGVRTSTGDTPTPNMLYVNYVQGSVEFYDLASDPYQLNSLQGSSSANVAQQRQLLQSKAVALRGCAGPTCHTLEFQ
jgi:N-acetylglucosamine-6-sulfatase